MSCTKKRGLHITQCNHYNVLIADLSLADHLVVYEYIINVGNQREINNGSSDKFKLASDIEGR